MSQKGHFKGWYGFDFDGTLVRYTKWVSATHIGENIEPAVRLLKAHIEAGFECRIFTARVYAPPMPKLEEITTGFQLSAIPNEKVDTIQAEIDDYHRRMEDASKAKEAIQNWCMTTLGRILPITCVKDYGMVRLYDDRCVQIEENTGRIVGTLAERQVTDTLYHGRSIPPAFPAELERFAGVTFYGPHACPDCTEDIVKCATEAGGQAFDIPFGVSRHEYTMTYPSTRPDLPWKAHVCKPNASKLIPTQPSSDSPEPLN